MSATTFDRQVRHSACGGIIFRYTGEKMPKRGEPIKASTLESVDGGPDPKPGEPMKRPCLHCGGPILRFMTDGRTLVAYGPENS